MNGGAILDVWRGQIGPLLLFGRLGGIPRQVVPMFLNFTPSSQNYMKIYPCGTFGSEDNCNSFKPLRQNFFSYPEKHFWIS